MTKYDTKGVVHTLDRHRGRTRHIELIFRRIVDTRVNTVQQRLTRVRVLELQITRRECHSTDIQIRVNRQVQNFQIPIRDHQTRISVVAEHDVEGVVQTLDRHRGRTRHIKLIFRRIVDTRVNTVYQRLTRIGVLELQITRRERHSTDIEVRVDRQVQNFQVAIRDHQTGISIVAEHHAEGIIHTLDRHRGST